MGMEESTGKNEPSLPVQIILGMNKKRNKKQKQPNNNTLQS